MSKKNDLDSSGLFEDVLEDSDTKAAIPTKEPDKAINLGDRKPKEGQTQVEFTDTIMVVDDSPTVLSIVSALLRRHHYNTLEFRDGHKAMQALRAMKPTDAAKLKAIYSDLEMPELGGMEFLKAVRRDLRFGEIPFVLFTSTADRAVVLRAGKLKVTGYLLKPITGDLMADSLHQLFPGRTTIRYSA